MSKIRIAIADDHDLMRQGIRKLVENDRIEVVFEARDGTDLLHQLATQDVDIILMDINMPNTDGISATQHVTNGFPNTRVVALTALEDEANTIRMLRAGARAYLLKSASAEELIRSIEDVHARGYHFSDLVSGRLIQSLHNDYVSDSTKLTLELSDREVEYLKLLCSELTNKEIADRMFVSPRTCEGWSKALCERLGVKSRIGLVLFAFRNNLVH